MDDRLTQFRVGVLVVATLLIIGLLVMLFGGMRSFVHRQYTVYVRFPEAPGVSVDTPVLKSGILIGRVSKVTLLDDGAVVTTLRIDRNRTLRNNEVCQIAAGNILGDAELKFVTQQGRQPNAIAYQDQDYLDGVVAKDPLAVMETATSALEMLTKLESDARTALASVQRAGDQVGSVAEGLNAVVGNNSDQFQRILTKTERTIDRLDFALGAIDRFIRDDNIKQKFEEIIGQIPDLITDASDVLETINESMGSFKDIGSRIDNVGDGINDLLTKANERIDKVSDEIETAVASANRNLQNLEGLTGPLGERGPELVESITSSMGRIDALLVKLDGSYGDVDDIIGNIKSFTEQLNSPDSTIGLLMNDRELYDRINSALASIDEAAYNVNNLSRRAGPLLDGVKPILKDLRIASDKIARDPKQLGVSGLLDRRKPSTKW